MNLELTGNVETLYFVLEYIGVFLAALVGGSVARSLNLDIIGFYFIALISSLAGGLMRDALLSDGPAAALTNSGYVITATIGAAIAYFTKLSSTRGSPIGFYTDVTTIGVWAVVGSTKAAGSGLPLVSCVLLGVVTATGGSMARDVVLNRVPSLFTSQKMYVFPAMFAATAMYLFNQVGYYITGMIFSAVVASLLTMALYWLGAYIPSKEPDNGMVEAFREKLLPPAGTDLSDTQDLSAAIEQSSDEEFLAALKNVYRDEVDKSD